MIVAAKLDDPGAPGGGARNPQRQLNGLGTGTDEGAFLRARQGFADKFGKRRFYVDEDSWNIVAVDCYDTRGNLWKVQEGHLIVERGLPASTTVPEIIYDLQARSYFATALRSEDEANNQFVDYDTRFFDPRELKRRATR